MKKLGLFVLFIVIPFSYGSTEFIVDGEFNSKVNSPTIRLKDTGFEVTGRVVLGNPSHACSKLKNVEEVSGNILYVKKRETPVQCRIVDFLKHAEEANASAVIYENNVYGGGFGFLQYYSNWEVSRKQWHTHAVEIAENKEISKALKQNKTVIATIVEGTNHVAELHDPLIALSVVYGLWAICIIILAVYKWRLFIKVNKLQASISQICLCLEIIAGILRLLSMVEQPYTRAVYPGVVTAAWELLVWPMVLTSTLLMTFYWEEAMRSAAVHSYPSLHKMKLPFGISVFILMFVACLTILFRGTNVDLKRGGVLNGLVVLCFTVPISIFYCVAAFQVLSRLYASSSLSKREASLYRMTAFLAGVAVNLVFAVIVLILLAILPLTKEWFIVSRFLVHLISYSVSTFQILAFQSPRTSGSNSSNSKGQDLSRNPSARTIPTLEEMEAAYSKNETQMESMNEETPNQDVE